MTSSGRDPVYLLDTPVLLHLIRDDTQAQAIDEQYRLSELRMRPLICEVSIGEMKAFAQSLKWGEAKRERLRTLIERETVIVHLSDPGVFDEYAHISTLAKSSGWPIFHGKNDLWVGAAARVSGSHSLTMDTDFLPLRSRPGWTVTVLDERTGRPLLTM